MLSAGLYTYSAALGGLDTDTICVSLGSMNNPSDSILSICAKWTEGGWDSESKRAGGGGWGGIKRKGGAGMLAGEEERSCWQVEEKSENSDGYKGYVYYTGHIHGEKLQEIKLDQRGHAVTLTTHTHTPHTHTHTHAHTRTHTHAHTPTEERKDMGLVLPSGGQL